MHQRISVPNGRGTVVRSLAYAVILGIDFVGLACVSRGMSDRGRAFPKESSSSVVRSMLVPVGENVVQLRMMQTMI